MNSIDIENMVSSAKNSGNGVKEIAHVLSTFVNRPTAGTNLYTVLTKICKSISEISVEFRNSGQDMNPSYDFSNLQVSRNLVHILATFSEHHSPPINTRISSSGLLLVSQVCRAVAQISKVDDKERAHLVQIGMLRQIVGTLNIILDAMLARTKGSKEPSTIQVAEKLDQVIFWSCNAMYFVCVWGKDINALICVGGVPLLKRLGSIVEEKDQNYTHVV